MLARQNPFGVSLKLIGFFCAKTIQFDNFKLLVALDDEEEAEGEMFMDDGVSQNPVGNGDYFLVKISIKKIKKIENLTTFCIFPRPPTPPPPAA